MIVILFIIEELILSSCIYYSMNVTKEDNVLR